MLHFDQDNHSLIYKDIITITEGTTLDEFLNSLYYKEMFSRKNDASESNHFSSEYHEYQGLKFFICLSFKNGIIHKISVHDPDMSDLYHKGIPETNGGKLQEQKEQLICALYQVSHMYQIALYWEHIHVGFVWEWMDRFTDQGMGHYYEIAFREHELTMGVHKIIDIQDSNDVIVIGKYKGYVMSGEKVAISYLDDFTATPTLLTTITDVEEITASSTPLIQFTIKNAKSTVNIGSIIHTPDISLLKAFKFYQDAMIDYYFSQKNLELVQEEIDAFTCTDCLELLKSFKGYYSKQIETMFSETNLPYTEHKDFIEKHFSLITKEHKEILDNIKKQFVKILYQEDELYYVSNLTDAEPYLIYNKTTNDNKQLSSTSMRISRNEHNCLWEYDFLTDCGKTKCIKNNSNKTGLQTFIQSKIQTYNLSAIDINAVGTVSIEAEFFL